MKHELTQEDRLKGNQKRWEGHKKIYKKCLSCDEEFRVFPRDLRRGKGKFCSQKCANEYNGKEKAIPRQVRSNGYVYLKTYDHPNRTAQNLIAEHRVVVENEIGRYLTSKEVVHHIDENTQNNEIGNLYLCRTRLEHKIAHVLNPESLRMLALAQYSEWEDFKGFNLLKGVQDQLQEMASESFHNMTFWQRVDMFKGFVDAHLPLKYNSWEIAWLSYVMKAKYLKVWDSEKEDWVSA